jgi:hypothetical protein
MPVRGPWVASHEAGMHMTNVKMMMTRAHDLKSRWKRRTPTMPSEKVNMLVFMAAQSAIWGT